MELSQLRYFVAICIDGNISKAARRLFMAQPSLSEQVRKLEQELGVALFERQPRQLVLTPAGKAFYEHAARILEEVERAQSHVASVAAETGTRLRVGVLPTVGARLLPAVIAEFRRAHPSVDVILREENSSSAVEYVLSKGELDVAVIRLGQQPPQLDSVLLLREPLVALFPPGHPLAAEQTVTLESLASEPLLLLKAGYGLRDVVLNALASVGVTARTEVEVSQLGLLIGLVQAGVGVTVLPRLAVVGETGVLQRPIRDAVATRELYVVWRRGLPFGAGSPLRTFVDLLRTHTLHTVGA